MIRRAVTYRCGRETYGPERSHEGIHDAYAVHGDSGSVLAEARS